MKVLKILGVGLIALLVVVAFAAPIGPLPGFFIGGSQSAAPDTWPDTSGVHEIRLKVGQGVPRVVIIWVVEHGGELHVVGDPNSGWVRKVGGGGPVEMRLGDATYALRAESVSDGKQAVLEAWLAKYEPDYPDIVAGFREADPSGTGAAVFRLVRG